MVRLREEVGIAATSPAIEEADIPQLVDLAVSEAVGYFSPRLLDREGARSILVAISEAA